MGIARMKKVELGCGMIYREIPDGGFEFYLGQRRKEDPHSYRRWSFFCGRRELSDPSIFATARRETREEAGIYNIRMDGVVGVYETPELPNLVKTVIVVGSYDGEPRAVPAEFFEGRWFTSGHIDELSDDRLTFGTREAIRDFLRKRGYEQD